MKWLFKVIWLQH